MTPPGSHGSLLSIQSPGPEANLIQTELPGSFPSPLPLLSPRSATPVVAVIPPPPLFHLVFASLRVFMICR